MIELPTDFMWGASTAAHQIEGGNVNADIWTAEWAEESIFNEPSGDACDSYHRYAEDISLLASAGLNTYRFGIEWARVEPEPGWYSRAALDHYRRVAQTCHEHGVMPVPTLHHFTAPRWFADSGGWSSSAADRFVAYADQIARHLGDLTPWILTINESNLMTVIRASGVAPLGTGTEGPSTDGNSGTRMAWLSPSVDVMADVHRRAIQAIKSVDAEIRTGWSLALIDLQADEGGEQRCEDVRRRTQLDWLEVSAEDDFIGVQTYTRTIYGPDGVVPSSGPRMQTGWEVYPNALEHTIRLAAEHSGAPVLVTENGMATDDDDARIAYTERALAGVGRCIADGIDVRGYLHWTLLDNFEWMAGYAKTFGLIAVDRDTFARTPKPSLDWLGRMAKNDRLPVAETPEAEVTTP